MSNLWEKIPGAVKAWVGAITAVFGLFWVAYHHFQTDAEASEAHQAIEKKVEDWQQQQVIASNRSEIWRAKREINRLEDEIRDPEISDVRKGELETDIVEYKELIECIQEGKDYCY